VALAAFNTQRLTAQEWSVVLVLAFIPAIAEELTKWYFRWRDKRAA